MGYLPGSDLPNDLVYLFCGLWSFTFLVAGVSGIFLMPNIQGILLATASFSVIAMLIHMAVTVTKNSNHRKPTTMIDVTPIKDN